MRNIFLFIRRYFTFLAFLAFQALALWFLFTYNKFHKAKGIAVSNEVTGWFNTRYNTFEDFFKMKEENRRLVRYINDSLVNLRQGNFLPIDTGSALSRDTVQMDTLSQIRHYKWRYAQAVYSTVNAEKNYVQINRGSNQGIQDNMGVFSSDGALIGQVVNVGPNFSQVMSLIHVQNKVNVMVKKSRNAGTLSWDGSDPRFLTLTQIPKSDSVAKGDTIVTGLYSLSFPPGQMVGTVADIVADPSTNFYVLKIKSAANFSNLQQVLIVENLQYAEQVQLNRDTQKKVDEAEKEWPVSDLLRNIIRFFLFIFVQVYVLNKVPLLHQFVVPYLYFLFLLWLPFSVSRLGLLAIAFVYGMTLGAFVNNPGLHAAACVLIAYLRPFMINILTPKDASEFNYREPSPRAMGWTPYLVYVLVLTFFHHSYLTVLQWLSFGSFFAMLIKIIATTAVSMLLIITTELLFPRKMKFRTNTA